jgi:hypothetical protein
MASHGLANCWQDSSSAMAKQNSPQPQSAQSQSAKSSQVKPEVVVLNWKTASHTVLDGKGGWFNEGRLTQLVIQSDFVNGQWRRPKNFTFKNWKLNGSIRVLGVGSSASKAVKESSFSLGHTERMQAAAPKDITLSGLKIKADEKIPLIVGPGATGVSLIDSRISGTSQSVAIYLDAESANNSIVNNIFKIKADRELIAVDGSRGNLIADNSFNRISWGGVYVYRNCGERGVVRHQEPVNNRITGNLFKLDTLKSYWQKNPKNGRQFEYRYGVWLGSREGSRAASYCGADKGFPFGSSVDNRDFANDNIVSGNRRIGSGTGYLLELDERFGLGGYNKFIKNDGRNNIVTSNRSVNSKAVRRSESSSAAVLAPDAPLDHRARGGFGLAEPSRLLDPSAGIERGCGCSLLGGFSEGGLLTGMA